MTLYSLVFDTFYLHHSIPFLSVCGFHKIIKHAFPQPRNAQLASHCKKGKRVSGKRWIFQPLLFHPLIGRLWSPSYHHQGFDGWRKAKKNLFFPARQFSCLPPSCSARDGKRDDGNGMSVKRVIEDAFEKEGALGGEKTSRKELNCVICGLFQLAEAFSR